MRTGRPIQNDYEKIKKMHEAGRTYRQIAEELEIGESSVSFALKKMRESEVAG